MSLEGQSVVVTGSTRGIGKVVATQLAAEGAKLAVVGRERRARRLGGRPYQGPWRHDAATGLIATLKPFRSAYTRLTAAASWRTCTYRSLYKKPFIVLCAASCACQPSTRKGWYATADTDVAVMENLRLTSWRRYGRESEPP
jgi:NAD(P)-dependent dehydrogenase (short-subunit alcohol dehydrogenase family)